MLATVGIVVQQLGFHVPGEQFTNTDIFGAPASVGFTGNLQILGTIGVLELMTFNKMYGDGEPGDYGLTGGLLDGMTEEEIFYRKEQEITHGRLAMIAFVGAVVQTLLFGPVV